MKQAIRTADAYLKTAQSFSDFISLSMAEIEVKSVCPACLVWRATLPLASGCRCPLRDDADDPAAVREDSISRKSVCLAIRQITQPHS